jgi:hypothetical protein
LKQVIAPLHVLPAQHAWPTPPHATVWQSPATHESAPLQVVPPQQDWPEPPHVGAVLPFGMQTERVPGFGVHV